MAEVGLLPIARVALQVCKAALPRYRSRFSKHQFTQPQLLAILCLVRYEDWIFREAEVRLGKHRELPGDESRPHRAIRERTPSEFAKEIAASRDLLGLQS
ncbi:MAG TPA: hypothetical protein VNE63_16105 [Candidatus Acidoferrales bacterium]|nr:hypothetical protein [Candidatus Acidoferrales bacterium]